MVFGSIASGDPGLPEDCDIDVTWPEVSPPRRLGGWKKHRETRANDLFGNRGTPKVHLTNSFRKPKVT